MKKITVDELRNYLNNQSQIKKVSMSGTYILLKKVMKYSFKRVHQYADEGEIKNNLRKFYEGAILQHQLKWLEYKLIFADEFQESFKDSSFYNWIRRSYPAVLNVNHDSYSMSLEIAISGKKVEDLMASTKWIIANIFDLFINDTYTRQTENERLNITKHDSYMKMLLCIVAMNFLYMCRTKESLFDHTS